MPAWVAPAAIAAGQAIITMAQNWRARKINERYVRQQNEYNSPRSQMARYQAAGLNPALVYSQGSPGNQMSLQSVPYTNVGQDTASAFNQSRLAQSQVQAQEANVRRTNMLTEVARLQRAVLAKNPYLDERAFEAIVDSFVSTAKSKAAQAGMDVTKSDWYTGVKSFNVEGQPVHEGPAGVMALEMGLKSLIQKYDLGTQDQKIKAEILQGKDFDNDLKELQVRWLEDAEMTPQHVLDLLKILLMKIK